MADIKHCIIFNLVFFFFLKAFRQNAQSLHSLQYTYNCINVVIKYNKYLGFVFTVLTVIITFLNHRTVLLRYSEAPNDWQLLPGCFLSRPLSQNLESVETSCIFSQSPLCLSARAACGGVPFTDSLAVSSELCYQVITDANLVGKTCCLREKTRERCNQERED